MTIDEIFQQADADMEAQRKSLDFNEDSLKKKKSFIKKSIKRFILMVVIFLLIILSLGIYFGYKTYKEMKYELLLQIESYRFEYEQLDEMTLTNAEVFAKKAFTLLTTDELFEISKSLGINDIGKLLSFSTLEHIDKIPEHKREDYKRICYFLQYINNNNCANEPFTEEIKQKYFGND